MSGIQGESITGYAPPKDGPFKCGNCEYFAKGSCGQSVMMESSKMAKTENGRVVVQADGCCTYFHSADKKTSHWMQKRGEK